MRLFLIITTFLFIMISILLGINYFNSVYKTDDTTENNNQEFKIVTVNIKIKDNLPIRKDLNLKTKYYFRLINKKSSIISLINKINISTKYFDILEQNLNIEISEDYTLILTPNLEAIEFYNRNTITYEILVSIGIKDQDAKEILKKFKDSSLSSEELIEKIKEILPTAKRKFLNIMKEFIIF